MAAYTDRLLAHAGAYGTYRQCSIGWHDECSQRHLGADGECRCICHDPDASYYTVEGHAEGGTVTVTRVEAGKHHWPPVPGEPATAWAVWVFGTSPEDASAKAKTMRGTTPAASEAEPEPEKPSEALQAACRHVLGHHHLEGGYPPGGFTAQLIDLWAKADMVNRYKLGMAFPEMAYAIDLLQNGQEDALRAVADGKALQ